jgi:hypothetical protein
MSDDKQPQDPAKPPPETTHQVTEKVSAGTAQVGNQKVPRPDKVSDRSVPDDIEE